jgi:succinyl-CoA synthetase alpha subunit
MITGQAESARRRGVRAAIRKGAYFDSVTLMRVGKEITALPGILDAAVVMATAANKAILDSSGLLTAQFKDAGDTDLVIAVKAESEAAAKAALAAVDALLKKPASTESRSVSLSGALQVLPDANLALISIAGRYAGDEAMRALEAGLHVMLFSDNVPLQKEIALKKFAAKRGLLVMGPDCGTAIINGVPLAFANVVNRGDIGIVAAAGTGLQEVSCIISNAGAGISQAIGTGGRDVKKEVGGIMFIEGLKALAKDEQTKVILLVSKPPHRAVLKKIEKVLKTIRKPVVTMFVGATPGTLEDAALKAVALSRGKQPRKTPPHCPQARRLSPWGRGRTRSGRVRGGKGRQKYIRGLFSGGTFCAEAQILLPKDAYSNAPTGKSKQLKNSLKSQKNTFLDLGEDEFTVGRPHPMIDYSLRNKRILEEAADPETAVILLDVVLGYGSNPDPASELAGVIREASRKVAVVCSITGTDKDPQNRSRVATELKKAGAIVMPSNAAACKLAGSIVQCL